MKKSFDHLFNVNDKAKGGSFYLQSKVKFNSHLSVSKIKCVRRYVRFLFHQCLDKMSHTCLNCVNKPGVLLTLHIKDTHRIVNNHHAQQLPVSQNINWCKCESGIHLTYKLLFPRCLLNCWQETKLHLLYSKMLCNL